MLRKFLPQNNNFFNFFEKQAAVLVRGAQALVAFDDSEGNPLEVFQHIKAFEEEGDSITHLCVEALHKTFITPIDRTEIHHLISTMDDVLDEIEDVGRLMVLYQLKHFHKDASQLAHIVLRSTQEVEVAVKELRKMKNTENLQNNFIKINHLENEADTILIHALSRLFDEEPDTRTLIKWKEVYEHLEHATDLCEDIANIIEGIILENE